jgi:hypothetical protein
MPLLGREMKKLMTLTPNFKNYTLKLDMSLIGHIIKHGLESRDEGLSADLESN